MVEILVNPIEFIKQGLPLTVRSLSLLRRPGPPVSRRVPVAAAAHPRDGCAVKRREEDWRNEPELGNEDAMFFIVCFPKQEAD